MNLGAPIARVVTSGAMRLIIPDSALPAPISQNSSVPCAAIQTTLSRHLTEPVLLARWWTPEDPQKVTEVTDASTGEVMARVCTDGIDIASAVDHGRTVGQGALGELTIHDRALLLKQLAQYLNEHKQELYDLSYATGATLKDHFFDVDGGIGTLFTFSSKGRRELPNANVVVDGAVEQLSRDGSFLGEHIYTRMPGVAVQINAFNFPVWGMLEKLAPAFIAGVPTIVKPATPTAYVAVAAVRMMIDSGALPEGALQVVAGSIPGLLDELGGQDHIGFTGSADTAAMLRRDPAVTERSAHFNAEADSLNASVLGPDAVPGEPEFDLFVKALVTEMTVKAGQKCTAIRRAIVPEPLGVGSEHRVVVRQASLVAMLQAYFDELWETDDDKLVARGRAAV